MSTILVIWTLIGFTGTAPASTYERFGWRPIGDFASRVACTKAGYDLGLKPNEFRCLDKN